MDEHDPGQESTDAHHEKFPWQKVWSNLVFEDADSNEDYLTFLAPRDTTRMTHITETTFTKPNVMVNCWHGHFISTIKTGHFVTKT